VSLGSSCALRSSVAGIGWPAVPGHAAARLLALQQQLEHSQWWARERIEAHQFRQLGCLLEHAFSSVPFYRPHLLRAGYRPGRAATPELLRALPVLSRRDIQDADDALLSTAIPAVHGRRQSAATSGSTGMPVTVVKTELEQAYWHAITLRHCLWQRRDPRLKLAAIRADPSGRSDYPNGSVQADWGPPVADVFETGPAALLDIRTGIAEQAEWLVRQDPDYVLSFGTNLLFLARHCRDSGLRLPRLKAVIASGEIVEPEFRRLCRDVWGVPLSDMYSAVEVGYVALQCPAHEHYHVQMEAAIVEVLDAEGNPCEPGDTGEVVVTPLHNYATPLIRYALGDFAEIGEPCPCGRGLTVLQRIVGRARDMIVLPTGERRFGYHSPDLLAGIAPIVQHQIAQMSREELEIRLVVRRPLTPEEEAAAIGLVNANYGGGFRCRISYRDEIARAPGGKYFVFRSELPA
jgi:phenylacetate-CoA ligase